MVNLFEKCLPTLGYYASYLVAVLLQQERLSLSQVVRGSLFGEMARIYFQEWEGLLMDLKTENKVAVLTF